MLYRKNRECLAATKPVRSDANPILIHIIYGRRVACCLTSSVAGELHRDVKRVSIHAVLGMWYKVYIHAVLGYAYRVIRHAVHVNRDDACGI